MPSPAGVSAPVSVTPTVTSGSSIFSANSWHASRKRAALYATKVLSTKSTSFVVPVIGWGSIRRPRRNLLCFLTNALRVLNVKNDSLRVEFSCQHANAFDDELTAGGRDGFRL